MGTTSGIVGLTTAWATGGNSTGWGEWLGFELLPVVRKPVPKHAVPLGRDHMLVTGYDEEKHDYDRLMYLLQKCVRLGECADEIAKRPQKEVKLGELKTKEREDSGEMDEEALKAYSNQYVLLNHVMRRVWVKDQ